MTKREDDNYLTVKQEKFAQAVAGGMNNVEALKFAGYDYSEKSRAYENGSRLRRKPKVAARIQELINKDAEANKITISSITNELIDLTSKAKDYKQINAAIRAVEMKARLHNLVFANRIEMIAKDGTPLALSPDFKINQAIVAKILDELLKEY